MSIRDDLEVARRVFGARLDDATATFEQSNTPGAALAYVSQQTILLTDLCAELLGAITQLSDDVERLKQ